MFKLAGCILISLIFSLLPVYTEGQPGNLNGLYDKIIIEKDTATLRKLNDDIRKIVRKNPDSSITLSEKTLKVAEKLENRREIANSLNNLAVAWYYLGQMDSSLLLNNRALSIFGEINDSIRYADVLINIGNIYFEKGDYPSARNNYERSYAIYIKQKYIPGQAKAVNNLGNTFNYAGNYKKALEYYFKTLQIENENKNSKGVAICSNNIGVVYHKLNNEDKALEYYNKAYSIYMSLDEKQNAATVLNQIATSFFTRGNNDTALYLYRKALDISKEINYELLIGVIENNMGELCLANNDLVNGLYHFETAYNINKTLGDEGSKSMNLIGQGKVLNRLNKFDKAITKLYEAYKTGTRINSIEAKRFASQELSLAYEGTGNYKKALEFHKIFKSMDDSTLNKSNIEKLTALQMQYDFDIVQKKQEFNQLKRELEYNSEIRSLKLKRQRALFAALLILVILTSAFLIYSARQQVKIGRLKVEVNNNMQRLLSQQMNPHFIFNTFKSIQNFLLKNDIKQSNFYLVQFSKLVRKNLENSQSEFISLKAEFEALELYMQLENLRLNDKFDYKIHIDEEIEPGDLKIPSLLFQPFVENSIWHGVSKIEGRGLIKIAIEPAHEKIRCMIEDNGVGRQKKTNEQTIGHRSLGSSITEKRIALLNALYKTNISTTITDLEDSGKNQGGTRVEFYLPVVY